MRKFLVGLLIVFTLCLSGCSKNGNQVLRCNKVDTSSMYTIVTKIAFNFKDYQFEKSTMEIDLDYSDDYIKYYDDSMYEKLKTLFDKQYGNYSKYEIEKTDKGAIINIELDSDDFLSIVGSQYEDSLNNITDDDIEKIKTGMTVNGYTCN